jgi:hypothetical protein
MDRSHAATLHGATVTHWRALIERDYLGAWDLVDAAGKAKDWTLTIGSVTQRKVYSQKAKGDRGKLTIAFVGARKPLICGAVMCATIEGLYGQDYEAWVGKPVTLYQTTTDVGPKRNIPCVRIRPVKPTAKAAEELPHREVDEAMRAKQDDAFRGERQPGDD